MYKNYRDRPKSPDVNYFNVVPNNVYNTNIHGKSENPLIRASQFDTIDKDKEAKDLCDNFGETHMRSICTLAGALEKIGYSFLISELSVTEALPMSKSNPIVKSKLSYGEYKRMQAIQKIEEEEEKRRKLDDAYWGSDNPEDFNEPFNKKQRYNNDYQSINNQNLSGWSDDEIDTNSKTTTKKSNAEHDDWDVTPVTLKKVNAVKQEFSCKSKKVLEENDEMW